VEGHAASVTVRDDVICSAAAMFSPVQQSHAINHQQPALHCTVLSLQLDYTRSDWLLLQTQRPDVITRFTTRNQCTHRDKLFPPSPSRWRPRRRHRSQLSETIGAILADELYAARLAAAQQRPAFKQIKRLAP